MVSRHLLFVLVFLALRPAPLRAQEDPRSFSVRVSGRESGARSFSQPSSLTGSASRAASGIERLPGWKTVVRTRRSHSHDENARFRPRQARGRAFKGAGKEIDANRLPVDVISFTDDKPEMRALVQDKTYAINLQTYEFHVSDTALTRPTPNFGRRRGAIPVNADRRNQ